MGLKRNLLSFRLLQLIFRVLYLIYRLLYPIFICDFKLFSQFCTFPFSIFNFSEYRIFFGFYLRFERRRLCKIGGGNVCSTLFVSARARKKLKQKPGT